MTHLFMGFPFPNSEQIKLQKLIKGLLSVLQALTCFSSCLFSFLAKLHERLAHERKSLVSHQDSCRRGFLALSGVKHASMGKFSPQTFRVAALNSRTRLSLIGSDLLTSTERNAAEVWADLLAQVPEVKVCQVLHLRNLNFRSTRTTPEAPPLRRILVARLTKLVRRSRTSAALNLA